MTTLIWKVGLALAVGPLVAQTGSALPEKRTVLEQMRKVNAWQVAHPAMGARNNNWERGTWYTGVMAAWKATGEQAFRDQALAWGRLHGWQVGTERNGGNKLFCVETWLELFFAEKDKSMIEPVLAWIEQKEPNSPFGDPRWYEEERRGVKHSYVDALYGAPALAMLTKATGDPRYLDVMHTFFATVTAELLDKKAGLYYRDYKYLAQKTARGKKILWSRGNGWAFGGIVRMLQYLPQGHPHRREYDRVFRRMAAELVKRQGADGLWRTNLDDPLDQPLPETSGTGFFCYGLAWGVNSGVLPRSRYLPAARKAWDALNASISPEGKVLWGQPVGEKPVTVKQDDSHEYVTGTFLLAASEIYKLGGK